MFTSIEKRDVAMRKSDSKPTDPSPKSSAVEFLTFVAATGGETNLIDIRYENENLWLTQKLIAELYGIGVNTVNYHLRKLFSNGELIEASVIRKFRITATDGKSYLTSHYSLQAIVAVGFKAENERAIQFRKWAAQILKDYTIQGWVMDTDHLISGHMFTDEYFERQLATIREIRLSERKFYQKVTDLFITAFDYTEDSNVTRQFFALVQNKLHWAVHRHTAAELIIKRANANSVNMGLSTWSAAPSGKIVKSDVSIAKNYLTDDELDHLARIVSMYLDYAELQAKRKVPLSMADWASRLDGFLEFNEREVLIGHGNVTHQQAKLYAECEFEKYRLIQDRQFMSDFDRFLESANRDSSQ